MTALTLASIEQALAQPFAPVDIKYLPKSPRQKKSGEWVCLALPYADKRAYEDRLNDLAFGYWSTPHNPPYAIGNKLIIPVTVTLFDIEHTDYGEAFASSLSRKGELREEENSATVAYSQGFRRACAQFRLGRYLYLLPSVWVPYDATTRAFAWTEEQRLQHTLRLYKKANVLLPEPRQVQGWRSRDVSEEPADKGCGFPETAPLPKQTAVSLVPGSGTSSSTSGSPASVPPESVAPIHQEATPKSPVTGRFRRWIRVNRNGSGLSVS
ncbi:hypothetical protein KDW_31000 [Dictyobacter vulcani]|uniref:Uncharacterized protein n=2 Tax=Dictyobacter vulcani TaxID=2607529 RepID=A0A5J4KGY2_9CHLR|nr:hypothetical protein KDW_31000 [Dictyobacter vulcani]